ncbi:MAG: CPBP family intramembrane metalloprotease [Acidobacteriia bacterium]|nr:CPBP family intramembrane metalloprotease [Terriglobia bacterium]
MTFDEDHSLPPEAAEPTAAPQAAEAPHESPAPARRVLPEDLRVPWGWVDLLLFVLISIFGTLALGVALVIGFHLLGASREQAQKFLGERTSISVLLQIALDFALLGFLAAHVRLRFHAPFWRTIGWRPLDTGRRTRGWTVLVLILAGLVLDVVVSLASAVSPPKQALPIETLFRDPRTALLFMLVAVVVAPVIEETIFRGYIYPVVARSWGVPAGVVVTGLLFGGLHAPQLWGGWAQIAALVIVGIALTLVRATTRTVVASFIVHTSYNSFQVLAILIGTHGLRHFPPMH